MKKHQSMKEATVVPRGAVERVNGEAAQRGEAAVALNVREQEDALQVTGMPAATGQIGPGERLLLITGGHYVTCLDTVVKIDGTAVATVDGAIVNAHAIGNVIVIVADSGFTYLSSTGTGWVVIYPADAIPQLSFTANAATSYADIETYEFDEAYSQWRAPLSTVDTMALARMLNAAWNALRADALAAGCHTSPMLVRWAVRTRSQHSCTEQAPPTSSPACLPISMARMARRIWDSQSVMITTASISSRESNSSSPPAGAVGYDTRSESARTIRSTRSGQGSYTAWMRTSGMEESSFVCSNPRLPRPRMPKRTVFPASPIFIGCIHPSLVRFRVIRTGSDDA